MKPWALWTEERLASELDQLATKETEQLKGKERRGIRCHSQLNVLQDETMLVCYGLGHDASDSLDQDAKQLIRWKMDAY
jgi:hypothetical protein